MSEANDSEQPRIKVTDRRLFDADGNLRDAATRAAASSEGEPESVEAGVVAEPSVAAESPTPPEASSPSEATRAEAAAPAARADTDAEGDATQPLQLADEAFLKFIEEQYIGGLLALGAMPEPQSGQMMEDLDLAQVRIEVLGMLEDRTEGTRTPETGKALTDVLYQLRMAYLQKRKVVKL